MASSRKEIEIKVDGVPGSNEVIVDTSELSHQCMVRIRCAEWLAQVENLSDSGCMWPFEISEVKATGQGYEVTFVRTGG